MKTTYGLFKYGQGVYGADALPILVTDRIYGFYNTTDLNRVESAFKYLQGKMNGKYGFALNLTIKTDWTMVDLAQVGAYTAMENYRQNVVKIRGAIEMQTGTPQTPISMNKLTAKEANDIEKILQAVEVLLNNISAAWFYSGEIYAGEV